VFLLGFFEKVSARRGVFVDSWWWLVWQRWKADARFFSD
jgi:hypothetical protein